MATGNQQPTSTLPFQEEMGLINYLRGPQKVQAGAVSPIQLAEPSGQDLNAIIQEFLRTDGRFLQNMLQQNTSGLYNSSTRKLLANDLLAQAAQKAALAKGTVSAQNAQLAQMATNANAQMAQSAQNANAASGAQSSKSRATELAIAALISSFARGGGGGAAEKSNAATKRKKVSDEGDGEEKRTTLADDASQMWSDITNFFSPNDMQQNVPGYGFDLQAINGPNLVDFQQAPSTNFDQSFFTAPIDFAADPATAFNFDTSWLNTPAPVGDMPSYNLPPEYSYSNNPVEQYGPLPESNYLNDIMGPVPDYYSNTGQEFIGPLPQWEEEEDQNFQFDW